MADAIFAAQMVDADEEKEVRKKLIKRGQTLLEKLEEIRYVKFEDAQQKLYDAQVVHMKEKSPSRTRVNLIKINCGSLLSLQN